MYKSVKFLKSDGKQKDEVVNYKTVILALSEFQSTDSSSAAVRDQFENNTIQLIA